MKALTLFLGPTTAWAATDGSAQIGTLDLVHIFDRPGHLAYGFGNLVEDLIDRHDPAQIGAARQQSVGVSRPEDQADGLEQAADLAVKLGADGLVSTLTPSQVSHTGGTSSGFAARRGASWAEAKPIATPHQGGIKGASTPKSTTTHGTDRMAARGGIGRE